MTRIAELDERLLAHLRAKGLKSTRQRKVILDAFVASDTHVPLDQILAKVQETMPGVGFATVYRTMKLFCDAGLAHERKFDGGLTCYEVAAVDQDEHHDHLICTTCGHIFEFHDEFIEQRQDDLAKARGLSIVSHRHNIYAECIEPEHCKYLQASQSS